MVGKTGPRQLFMFLDTRTGAHGNYPKSHLRAVPYDTENYFYHISLPPLNVTISITHVRNGSYANDSQFR